MRHMIPLVGLIPLAWTYAQKPVEKVVYSSMIDTLVKCNEFDFYNPQLKHSETHAYRENPLDSLLVFNP